MRLDFKLSMSGKDTLRTKLAKAIQENPNLHIQLISSVGGIILKAIGLDKDDDISIDAFALAEYIEYKVEEKS